MDRLFFVLGSASAFLGVCLGAFAAHGLKSRLAQDMLNTFEVGIRYQMYHALALLAVAWAFSRWPRPEISASGCRVAIHPEGMSATRFSQECSVLDPFNPCFHCCFPTAI